MRTGVKRGRRWNNEKLVMKQFPLDGKERWKL
ncbi:hypothetical protein CLOBOL_01235 [Enterocloster bolteae ATCC BAA-613]|jgi:hypothetical protein|uniref:Uncharacterized protein n=1 Tax=Enterocloster bolteae (strain ATCC BAA-613 / DSM 15670 / CCUG 46953 / JCM 12243 / WAL 16351) TaxID=411902 RepID=A8RK83_ENTBW|nr:hypothetical protein CLOBOL_01235 [Enterocloster bolteae ATCC BAA-613]